jgi:hypothetical protein
VPPADPPRRTRRPWLRLPIVAAALLSLVVGYYLGQHWQRRGLDQLTALVYPGGKPVAYPDALRLTPGDVERGRWRLFAAVDTRIAECKALLRDYGLAVNRLAAWPDIQPRVRVTMLAYDGPDLDAIRAFSGLAPWVEVVGAPPGVLDQLAGQLGILPSGGDWCVADQANAVLVSPRGEAWALVPRDPPAVIADNLGSIISFVE